MIEPVIVTLLPAVFLVILFGGGMLLRRKNIDMDGKPPINKRIFYISKYSILGLWAAMVMQSWGINLALVQVPGLLKWISLCLWIAGFMLLFIGRLKLADSFRIGSAKESTRLKVDGLYRLSRNPMYLGMYATVVASVLYTLNPVLFLAGVFVVAVHHKIVLAEEQYLQTVFGEEYVRYCNRVKRYL